MCVPEQQALKVEATHRLPKKPAQVTTSAAPQPTPKIKAEIKDSGTKALNVLDGPASTEPQEQPKVIEGAVEPVAPVAPVVPAASAPEQKTAAAPEIKAVPKAPAAKPESQQLRTAPAQHPTTRTTVTASTPTATTSTPLPAELKRPESTFSTVNQPNRKRSPETSPAAKLKAVLAEIDPEIATASFEKQFEAIVKIAKVVQMFVHSSNQRAFVADPKFRVKLCHEVAVEASRFLGRSAQELLPAFIK